MKPTTAKFDRRQPDGPLPGQASFTTVGERCFRRITQDSNNKAKAMFFRAKAEHYASIVTRLKAARRKNISLDRYQTLKERYSKMAAWCDGIAKSVSGQPNDLAATQAPYKIGDDGFLQDWIDIMEVAQSWLEVEFWKSVRPRWQTISHRNYLPLRPTGGQQWQR